MKNFLLAVTAIFLISCSGGDPAAIALEYSKAFNAGDFEGAKQFATPQSGKMIDLTAQMIGEGNLEKLRDAKPTLSVATTNIEDEQAYVTIVVKNGYNPGTTRVDDEQHQEVFLRKFSGRWYVVFDSY